MLKATLHHTAAEKTAHPPGGEAHLLGAPPAIFPEMNAFVTQSPARRKENTGLHLNTV